MLEALSQPGRDQVGRLLVVGTAVLTATLLAACQPTQPQARTFYDFKEDSVARDGVLSRCDRNPEAAASDLECIAARRAAAAVALERERARSGALEQQSERKLVALRNAGSASDGAPDAASSPAFGAPIGAKLPSMTDSADPYDVRFPALPTFELGEVQPPVSEIEIVRPQLTPEDIAVVPPSLPGTN